MDTVDAPPDSLSPAQLITVMQTLCRIFFPDRQPELLTTNRSGGFEAAWLQGEGGGWRWAEPRPYAMRPYVFSRLGKLMGFYARHPGADHTLLTRNAEFPLSLELLLPPADPA